MPDWTPAEDALLAKYYSEGKSAPEISSLMNRTVRAVVGHRYRLRDSIPPKTKPWRDQDDQIIREWYASHATTRVGFKLNELANQLGRTRFAISIRARRIGISNISRKGGGKGPRCRKFVTLKELRAAQSERQRLFIALNGHPRGALGMKHSPESRRRIGEATRRMNNSLSPSQMAVRTLKAMKTRLRNHGTIVTNPRPGTTWKSGWREVAGRRIYFRSRWEFNYALYLQLLVEQGQIKSWDHEPKTFWFEKIKRGCCSYLPDFLVVNRDDSEEYHEVKGWMDDRSKTKIKRMKKYYPDVVLRVIGAQWFKENGPKLSFLPGWESMARTRPRVVRPLEATR